MTQKGSSAPLGFFISVLLSWSLNTHTLKRTSNDSTNHGNAIVNFSLAAIMYLLDAVHSFKEMFVSFSCFVAEKSK